MTNSVPLETSGSGVRFAACCWRVGGSRECAKQVRAPGGLILDGLSRYDPEKLFTARVQEEGLAQKLAPLRILGRRRARI